jgi:hypothetical protein
MEKQAAYKEAFFSRILPKASGNFVRATRPLRKAVLDHENNSLVGFALGTAKEHGVLGAEKVHQVLTKARLHVSDLDTGLGHMAAGSKYNMPKGERNMRATVFTDSDTAMDGLPNGMPSITQPIKWVGKTALPMLGYWKAMDIYNNYRNKDKVVQHEPGIVENGSYPMSGSS